MSFVRKACTRCFLVAWVAGTALGQVPTRLDRTNLLVFTDPQGQFRRVETEADWRVRRASILRGMETVMGKLPGDEKRCALDLRIEEETDCGNYVRRFITYASEPGSRVPAYLLIPKAILEGKRETFGVLCLHQTHAQGQRVVVGLGNSPDDEYGVELAERGYVCLAPAYPLLANYAPDLRGLGYASGTMKAIWDNIRGLDLLEEIPGVRKGKFAAIGHSLGGHNGLYTAVFEPRIRVVVTSCGFDSFVDYMDGNLKGWSSDRYMPRILNYAPAAVPFDFYEVIGALAPRFCFISAPVGDTNFKWRSVEAIVKSVRSVYSLHGVPDRLRVEHPDCGHRFPPDVRRRAYEFLEKGLGAAPE